MIDTPELHSAWDKITTWFLSHFWSINTLYEASIVFGAFAAGSILTRISMGHISEAIDKLEVPIRIKRNIDNLKRIVFPITTLAIMFLATVILSSDFIGIDISLTLVTMKVLLAWIIIRIALQVVANSFVRNLFAIGIWLIAALSILGVLDETTTTLDAVGFNIGSFRLSALAVIKSFISLFVLLYLATFISTFAERRVLKSKSLTRSSQVLIAKIIRIALIVCALLIGVTSAGIDLSIFAVFSGAVGLGVGFGLQKVVSNLFSGLLLLMDKSITPGDVIEIQDSGTFGWVNHMGARYTEIITRDNKSFLIPNEDFVTQRVVNWSHGNKLIRIQVEFGVHYDSDPHKVIAAAIEAATCPERVVETPTPQCWITEFADSSLNFSLRFWIQDAEQGITNVKGQVMLALWDAFKKHNIDIPYPHREVFVHQKS